MLQCLCHSINLRIDYAKFDLSFNNDANARLHKSIYNVHYKSKHLVQENTNWNFRIETYCTHGKFLTVNLRMKNLQH